MKLFRKLTRGKIIRGFAILTVGTVITILIAQLFTTPVEAAALDDFSIRPSRIAVSETDVNFLIKATDVNTTPSEGTEDEVTVTFETGYTVDGTPANITVTTTGITDWDSGCTNAWPSIGSAATGVSGQEVTFASGELTVGQTYCFIITAGIDNPATAGNYSITVETLAASAAQDNGIMVLPIVADVGGEEGDEVHISAQVGTFVRCSVTTTVGSDNSIDLGTLTYGTVTSSSDDIEIQGGTNATGGMVWYYRSDSPNNGLYSPTTTELLDGATAESSISATTATCSGAAPCFGIYYNGTTTATTGSFSADGSFIGGTATTDVGPLTTNIYGIAIGNSGGSECSEVTAQFNVNATAAENTQAGTDFTEVLIFTCRAEVAVP